MTTADKWVNRALALAVIFLTVVVPFLGVPK